jgi:hypothetical protein
MRIPMRWTHLVAAAAFAAPTVAQAQEPVLVPDFTPGSVTEFAVSFMLQDLVLAQLRADGWMVVDSTAAHPVVGDTMMGCADLDSCPRAALVQLPVRVAVVVKIDRRDGRIVGQVAIYEQSDSAPVDTRQIQVAQGQEELFANEVVAATRDVMSLLGPSPEHEKQAAGQLIADSMTSKDPVPVPPPTPEPEPAPGPAPVPIPVVPEPVLAEPVLDYETAELEVLLAATGVYPRHLLGSEGNFRKQELDARDWLHKMSPHAGRFTVEVRTGVGIGDVDRTADVRIDIDESGNQVGDNPWFQEGPTSGSKVRGGLYFGYAPITMLDLGMLVGLQYGARHLTTGWFDAATGQEDEADLQTVQSVQVYLQPRVRAYLVPVGPAKPYLVAGAELRMFDRWQIQQPEGITYPIPPGGLSAGPMGGGGLMIDPGPIVGFFAEGTFSYHLGLRGGPAEDGEWNGTVEDVPLGTRTTVGVVGGVQFRI